MRLKVGCLFLVAGSFVINSAHFDFGTLFAGGVDLLLHLLSNIVNLPVTMSIVKESGMGKAIGAVEKHRLCKGTPNESIIKDRVQQIKDAWHASVKARKPRDASKEGAKRPSEAASPASSVKRIKTESDPKKSSSFSTLLKKVSGLPDGAPPSGSSASANEKWSTAVAVASTSGAEANSNRIDAETGTQANGQADKEGECAYR
jgi:TFIIS helical bundle-like domain